MMMVMMLMIQAWSSALCVESVWSLKVTVMLLLKRLV